MRAKKKDLGVIIRKWEKSNIKNKHHLRPKSRGWNLCGNHIWIDTELHKAWHFLFGVMTFIEVSEILKEINELVTHNPKIVFDFDLFFKEKRRNKAVECRKRR